MKIRGGHSVFWFGFFLVFFVFGLCKLCTEYQTEIFLFGSVFVNSVWFLLIGFGFYFGFLFGLRRTRLLAV